MTQFETILLCACLVIGHLLMIPSVVRFGYGKTSGDAGGLETRGLYQVSRNPQYVGDMLILVGWVLVGMVPLAAVVAGLGLIVFLIAPLAEEPWLAARYGDPYLKYKQTVRRFV